MTAKPNLIVQKLNDEWLVPKQLTEDLTVYVKDLKDKYKTFPVKIKKDKTAIKSDKKEKDDKYKSKKEKQSKEKSDKTIKEKKAKEVKEKKMPPTEEELLLKKQLQELEAEKRRQEMNKKFIFPLQDAIGDEFFMTKFTNWKKVNWRKGKKRNKTDLVVKK